MDLKKVAEAVIAALVAFILIEKVLKKDDCACQK